MHSTPVKSYAPLLGLLLTVVACGYCWGAAQTIIVKVDAPPLAWSGFTLDARLHRHLSRTGSLNVVTVSNSFDNRPEFPHGTYHVDSLVNWGMEVGGRYLLTVEIYSERLETRKSFHLPLVFHKYETVGVIEGEFHLIDVTKGKLLLAESFKVEQNGPRIFQATMDDVINDPDLHVTAPGKVRFFGRLEEKLAVRLVERVKKMIRIR